MPTYSWTQVGNLLFVVVFEDSAPAEHPSVVVNAPSGFRVIGGGGRVNWAPPQPGALLTAMYPAADGSSWTVASKDHNVPFTHTVTGYAICCAIAGPGGTAQYIADSDYAIIAAESVVAAHPFTTADLTGLSKDFTLVGGGARANWHGDGQLLVASCPNPGYSGTWYAQSKDHEDPDPSTITVWAVGLRSSLLAGNAVTILRGLNNNYNVVSSGVGDYPSATTNPAGISKGGCCIGGGAWDRYRSQGNMLTASYPTNDGLGWTASGKDHQVADQCSLDVYCLAAVPSSSLNAAKDEMAKLLKLQNASV